MARKDEKTKRVIANNPLNRAQARLAGFLPPDPGEIPAFRLADAGGCCNPAFGY
jgi:hypothetical protein